MSIDEKLYCDKCLSSWKVIYEELFKDKKISYYYLDWLIKDLQKLPHKEIKRLTEQNKEFMTFYCVNCKQKSWELKVDIYGDIYCYE